MRSATSSCSGTAAPTTWSCSQFLKAVRNKTQTPLDVYDSVVMSVINPLSEKSIAEGAMVDCPDFTRGKWKTRKPVFAL